MPTQDENTLPWPLCENLLANPCNPPLCARRPPRTPMSGVTPPQASLFPLAARVLNRAICSNRKLLRQAVQQPRSQPLQRALGLRQRLTRRPQSADGHGLVWVNTDSHVYHKEG